MRLRTVALAAAAATALAVPTATAAPSRPEQHPEYRTAGRLLAADATHLLPSSRTVSASPQLARS